MNDMTYDFYLNRKCTLLGKYLVLKMHKGMARICRKYSPSGGALLEIGFGKGLFANEIKSYPFSYTCIDVNENICDYGKYLGYEVFNSGIPLDKSLTGVFDIIYSCMVIEHLSFDDISKSINSLKPNLSENGKFIIVTNDYSEWGKILWDYDYTHKSPVTARNLTQVFFDCGFILIEKKYIRGPFKSAWVYPFHIVNKIVFSALHKITDKEIFFKMAHTFGRNMVLVFERIK